MLGVCVGLSEGYLKELQWGCQKRNLSPRAKLEVVLLINKARIHFIGNYPSIIFLGSRSNMFQIAERHNPPGGIAGRVKNDKAGFSVDQAVKLVKVEGKIILFLERHWNRFTARYADGRSIAWKSRVGIDHFITWLNQR